MKVNINLNSEHVSKQQKKTKRQKVKIVSYWNQHINSCDISLFDVLSM